MKKHSLAIAILFTLSTGISSAASTEAISVSSSGAMGTDASNSPKVNYNGRYVVYESSAPNILSSNGIQHVYRTDRVNGSSIILSQSNAGTLGNSYSFGADISDDGNVSSFTSYASNIASVPKSSFSNIFIRNVSSGKTTLISNTFDGTAPNGNSSQSSISGDGNWVAFVSYATNITSDNVLNTGHIYLHNITTGITTLVSKSPGGAPGNAASLTPAISADGRYVVYSSLASNLGVNNDTNSQYDIYVYDRVRNINELVSVNDAGVIGDKKSSSPAISADGRFISYHSFSSNLDLNYNTSSYNIFLRDRQYGETRLVSKNGASVADSFSFYSSISSNGRFVSFISRATNLVTPDANPSYDLFVYDRITGAMEILSRNNAGTQIDGSISFIHDLSGDGQVAVFASAAPNLGANNIVNVFARVRDPIKNIAPVAVAGPNQTVSCTGKDTTIFLDGRASYDLDGTISQYVWSDGYTSLTGSTAQFTVPTGSHVFDLTVTDNNNDTGSDSVNVSVIDNEFPTLTLTLNSLEATSSLGAKQIWDFSLASDNCSTPSVSVSPLLEYYPLGETQVTITLSDASNNVTTIKDKVVVVDTIAPVFDPINDFTVEATGTLTPVVLPTPSASDLFDISYSNDAVTSYGLGDYVINWTATDTSSNSSMAQQNLHVVDTTPPVLDLGPDLTLEANTSTGATHTITPVTVSDSCQCGQLNLVYTNQLAVYPIGKTVVSATVTDQSGNATSDSLTITVVDTTAPQITAPLAVTAEATGPLTNVSLGQASATDLFKVTVTNNAPASFPLGDTTVIWTATDENGNSATASQVVHIIDTTPPSVDAGADITLEASSSKGASYTINPIVKDICDCGQLTIDISPALTVYPLGKTTLTVTAKDQSGNVGKDTMTIEVVDTTKPTLIAPPDLEVEATAALSPVMIGNATASDFFGVTVSNNAPAVYPVGKTLVVWTAIDGNGNVATATQTINVVDTTAPSFTIDILQDTLWPPRHRLVHAANVVDIKDLVDEKPVVEITVTTEDKHHKQEKHRLEHPDWKIVENGDHWEIWLRASKLIRSQDDRIYSIEVKVTDMYNNQAVQTAEVIVPHSRKQQAHEDHKKTVKQEKNAHEKDKSGQRAKKNS